MQSHITGYLRWHVSVFIIQSQRRWRHAEGKQETCRWKTSKPWISRKARAEEIMWKRRLQESQCHLARLAPADKTCHKSCSRLPRWYAPFTCFVLVEYLLIMFDRFHGRALLDWQNLPQQFSIKHLPVSHLSRFHLHLFLLQFTVLCHFCNIHTWLNLFKTYMTIFLLHSNQVVKIENETHRGFAMTITTFSVFCVLYEKHFFFTKLFFANFLGIFCISF